MTLKGLQGCLGELNDVAAHKALCKCIAESTSAHIDSRIGFDAGVALGREEAKLEGLMARSQKALGP